MAISIFSRTVEKNSNRSKLRIEEGLSLSEVVSKCCKLLKLCHINHRAPGFLRHSVFCLDSGKNGNWQ